MEDVIFLGCIGTISSSWHASPAKGFIEFNGYGKINHKICLRPGRKGGFWAAFVLIGLLGELVWHLFVRSWITLSNKFFWYCNDCCAFSRKFFMHSRRVSSFSISLLHLKHNHDDTSCSFSTGIPNTEDNLAATFCFFEVSPSNKSRVMHRCITRDHMSFIYDTKSARKWGSRFVWLEVFFFSSTLRASLTALRAGGAAFAAIFRMKGNQKPPAPMVRHQWGQSLIWMILCLILL